MSGGPATAIREFANFRIHRNSTLPLPVCRVHFLCVLLLTCVPCRWTMLSCISLCGASAWVTRQEEQQANLKLFPEVKQAKIHWLSGREDHEDHDHVCYGCAECCKCGMPGAPQAASTCWGYLMKVMEIVPAVCGWRTRCAGSLPPEGCPDVGKNCMTLREESMETIDWCGVLPDLDDVQLPRLAGVWVYCIYVHLCSTSTWNPSGLAGCFPLCGKRSAGSPLLGALWQAWGCRVPFLF